MRKNKANSELQDLQKQLRDAVEADDLQLMSALTNKIRDVRERARMEAERLKEKERAEKRRLEEERQRIEDERARFFVTDPVTNRITDPRTGLVWKMGNTCKISKRVRLNEKNRNFRLPTKEELVALVRDIRTPVYSGLARAGFFNIRPAGCWMKDSVVPFQNGNGNIPYFDFTGTGREQIVDTSTNLCSLLVKI